MAALMMSSLFHCSIPSHSFCFKSITHITATTYSLYIKHYVFVITRLFISGGDVAYLLIRRSTKHFGRAGVNFE